MFKGCKAEPPPQANMLAQNLPPRTSNADVGFVQGSPLVLLVTSPEQLPAALKQRDKQAAIEKTQANARLIQDLGRLLHWESLRDTGRLLIFAWLIIWLTQMVITNRYKLEADWHLKWKAIEMGGKITLTPSEK